MIRAEMLLQAAFFAASNPLFVVEWNTRRILAASETVERVFGYRPEEIRDHSTEFLHVDADSFQRFGEISEQAMTEGCPVYHGYFRMKRRNGMVFDSEHLVSLVTDDDNRPLAAVSIVRDLSEKGAPPLPGGREPDFRSLSENIPGGLFQRRRGPGGELSYTYMRGILFRRMGVDAEEARQDAHTILNRIHADDRQRLVDALERSSETLSTVDMKVRVLTTEDELLWVRTISQPRRQDDDSVIWDGILLDITEQHKAEEELSYLAMFDSLTGLPNVRTFDKRVSDAVIHARVYGSKCLLALINIERFYAVNERLGYDYGDTVLRTLAERLLSITRGNDMAARSQGDEFLILFQNLAGDEEVNNRIARLQQLFDEPVRFSDDTTLPVHARIGMAVFPGDGTSAETLRRAADVALKHARRSRGLHYAFYSPDMTRQLVESLELEDALRTAIGMGGIDAWYQPQYDLGDGRLTGFESLARWSHGGEWISPSRFIPLAEETGLIHPLGRLFADKVFKDIRGWQEQHFNIPPIAINLSAYQVREPGLVDWLMNSVGRYGLAMDDITIEITESAFLLDFEGARDVLNSMHGSGLRLSMDDFGTGYSSLSYLSQLPFRELKIDQSFTALLGNGTEKAAVVRGIIDLAHALNIRVVAEGVETVEQLAALRDMRCDAAQGYLFSRPAEIDTFTGEVSNAAPHPVFDELPDAVKQG